MVRFPPYSTVATCDCKDRYGSIASVLVLPRNVRLWGAHWRRTADTARVCVVCITRRVRRSKKGLAAIETCWDTNSCSRSCDDLCLIGIFLLGVEPVLANAMIQRTVRTSFAYSAILASVLILLFRGFISNAMVADKNEADTHRE